MTTELQRSPNRRPLQMSQLGLHLLIAFLLLLSLVPTVIMINLSFKNGLQYRWERWNLSLPLRGSNYLSAWDVIDAYMINTVLVAWSVLQEC